MALPTLTQACENLAAVLSSVYDFQVNASGPVPSPRPGDGWIVVGPMSPYSYTGYLVELRARIVMHHELKMAEQLYRQRAVGIMHAIAQADLGSTDVVVEPAAFVVGELSSPLYCVEVSLQMEVGRDA